MQELIDYIRSSPITTIGCDATNERHLDAFLSIFSDYDRLDSFIIGDVKKAILDFTEIKLSMRERGYEPELSRKIRSSIRILPKDRNLILKTMTYVGIDGSCVFDSSLHSSVLYGSNLVISFEDNIKILKNLRDTYEFPRHLLQPNFEYSELRNFKIDTILK